MLGTVAPVIAGLAAGIALIVVFSLWAANSQSVFSPSISQRRVSEVMIPNGASDAQLRKNFEPSIITVVIGVNNTVRWINNDTVPSSVTADNTGEDRAFEAATQSASRESENFIMPGKSFDFTFYQPGWINYHSEPHPWMQGTVKVLPSQQKVSLAISGLKESYKVGELINVSVTQTGGGCGFPSIIVKDDNQQTVLTSNGNALISCPVIVAEDLSKFSMTWTPSNHSAPIIMNRTGTYLLIAEYRTTTVEQRFTVAQ
jgi:plastocyanin